MTNKGNNTDKMFRCLSCGIELPDYIPVYCCSGLREECGCMGMPIEPPICSQECMDFLLKNNINQPLK